MKLFSYSTEELQNELNRRKNLENQKVVYMCFYDSVKLLKSRYGINRMIYLLPQSIFKKPSYDGSSRTEHNLSYIKEFKEKGYKIVLFCPEVECQYNTALFYYADEVIIY